MSTSIKKILFFPHPVTNKNSIFIIRILNAISYLAMISVNIYGMTIENSIANISKKYPTWITPSNETFILMWSIIYITLGIFTLYQLCPITYNTQNRHSIHQSSFHLISHAVSVFFILTCIFNIAWILFWINDLPLCSLLAITLIVITSFILYIRFQPWLLFLPNYSNYPRLYRSIGRDDEITSLLDENEDVHTVEENGSVFSFWMIRFPFSLYFGWLIYAIILNLFACFFVVEPTDPYKYLNISYFTLTIIIFFQFFLMIWRHDATILFVNFITLLGIANSNIVNNENIDSDNFSKFCNVFGYMFFVFFLITILYDCYVVKQRFVYFEDL